jgi:hypothetical protein
VALDFFFGMASKEVGKTDVKIVPLTARNDLLSALTQDRNAMAVSKELKTVWKSMGKKKGRLNQDRRNSG